MISVHWILSTEGNLQCVLSSHSLWPQLCAAEIEKLRGHVASMGGDLGDGWSATLKLRTAGQRAGQYDVYFYAPDGAMYRSKVGDPSVSRLRSVKLQEMRCYRGA